MSHINTANDKLEEVRIKSSQCGPNRLGYTRATIKITKFTKWIFVNKNFFHGLLTVTRFHEVGITSNRKSECYGEYVPWPCTHRPSHAESQFHLKILNIFKNVKNLFSIYWEIGNLDEVVTR